MTSPLQPNKIIKNILTLLFVASIFTACDEQVVYHSYHSLPTMGWQRGDTLQFDVPVTDSSTIYNIFVEVRNRSNYSYQNLILLISHDTPELQNTSHDTLEMKLTNSQGAWMGDGWGGLYQSSMPAGHVYIDKAGNYSFKITHLLPNDTLVGINDVGIKLKR